MDGRLDSVAVIHLCRTRFSARLGFDGEIIKSTKMTCSLFWIWEIISSLHLILPNGELYLSDYRPLISLVCSSEENVAEDFSAILGELINFYTIVGQDYGYWSAEYQKMGDHLPNLH